MPAVPTISHGDAARRTSFYGRSRATSSNGGSSSASSSSSSRQHGNYTSSSAAPSSSSSSMSSAKTASSVQRSLSPLGKKQAVVTVAAAATAASKKLSLSVASSNVTSEKLRSEAGTGITFDEQAYHGEIVKHMHHMEHETVACLDLMDAQPELRWYMRPYLVDFVVEIHQTFRLRPETLFLTMNIVDRYVSKRIVYKRHYQLVGCAALLIAAKFEDAKDKVPLVSELAQMCCSAYDESAFVQMEGHVLSTVGWTLGFPTPEAWLRLACATAVQTPLADCVLDGKTLNVARFLLETTLFTRDFVGALPSHLTEGSLLLARIIAARGDGNAANMAAAVVAASSHAIDVAQRIDAHLVEHAHALSEILIKKYSFSHCHQASAAVVAWYAGLAEQREVAAANGDSLPSTLASLLLPAPRFATSNDAAAGAVAAAVQSSMTKSSSSSSFSTPRRSAEDAQDEEDEEDDDDDDNVSMHSRSTASSSMISTPSQMSTDGEEEDDHHAASTEEQSHDIRRRVHRHRHHRDDDEEDEDDDESDMPVTPLSLNSLHDPLVATEARESGKPHNVAAMIKTVATSAARAANEQQQQFLQPRDDRRVLALSQQDNRLAVV